MAAPRLIKLRFAFRPNAGALSGKRPKPASSRLLCEFGTNDKGAGDFFSDDGLTGGVSVSISSLEKITSLFGSFG